MKPEELMIGDVLEYMGTIVKVYSIGAKICVKECFGKNTYIVNFDNLLKGIELTPEILEQNGFEECRIEEIEYYGWRLNEDFSLERNAIDTLIWNDDVSIHSVHQLQHALRFCGINKEIEI